MSCLAKIPKKHVFLPGAFWWTQRTVGCDCDAFGVAEVHELSIWEVRVHFDLKEKSYTHLWTDRIRDNLSDLRIDKITFIRAMFQNITTFYTIRKSKTTTHKKWSKKSLWLSSIAGRYFIHMDFHDWNSLFFRTNIKQGLSDIPSSQTCLTEDAVLLIL